MIIKIGHCCSVFSLHLAHTVQLKETVSLYFHLVLYKVLSILSLDHKTSY